MSQEKERKELKNGFNFYERKTNIQAGAVDVAADGIVDAGECAL